MSHYEFDGSEIDQKVIYASTQIVIMSHQIPEPTTG